VVEHVEVVEAVGRHTVVQELVDRMQELVDRRVAVDQREVVGQKAGAVGQKAGAVGVVVVGVGNSLHIAEDQLRGHRGHSHLWGAGEEGRLPVGHQ